MRLIKVVLVLVILGFAALVGFAYLGNFTPADSPMNIPVQVPGTSNVQ